MRSKLISYFSVWYFEYLSLPKDDRNIELALTSFEAAIEIRALEKQFNIRG